MPKSKKTIPIYEYKEKVNGQIRYYIRPCVNGKQITKRVDDCGNMWLGRDGYNQAFEYYKKILKIKKYNSDINQMSIHDVANEYLDYCKRDIKKRTYRDYETIVNLHILPFFKTKNTYVKFLEIDNATIIKWQKYISEKNTSIAHRQKIHCVFSYIFNYAMKVYNINYNPLRNVGNFKNKKGHIKEKDYLTEEEFEFFHSHIKGQIYKDFFKVMFFTGTRIGELCGIKLKNIDLKNKVINVKNSVWQHAPTLEDVEDGTKTDASTRLIPILDNILPLITVQYNKTLNEYNDLDAYLFSREKEKCHNGRTFLAESTIRRHLDDAMEMFETKREITPHSLRHSFITMCAKKGIDVRIVAKIVGHKDIMTTYSIYTHVSNEEVNNFNNLFYKNKLN